MKRFLGLALLAAVAPCGGEEAALDRKALLGKMVPIIRAAIDRQDTKHPVFHGCWDWHSAVHGHWALLRAARATGAFADEAKAADASLTAEGLAGELKILQEHPEFEMPYGRAWFLRLAIEHRDWAKAEGLQDPDRLAPMADAVAASLMAFFGEFPPSPATHEYANNSWPLVQLHDYLKGSGDAAGLARVQAWIRDRFVASPCRMDFGSDGSRPEFFSPFGNWAYLVARTQDAAALEAFLKAHPLADADLVPVTRLLPYPHGIQKKPLVSPHQLGLNWSRAWALKALADAARDPAAKARFEAAWRAHVEAGMRLHEAHAGDFMMYDHWVPQFAVYALTEGE